MNILNLTQHPATIEQIELGVVDLRGKPLKFLQRVLTFDTMPTSTELIRRLDDIAGLAIQNGLGPDDGEDPIFKCAMIGGEPWLMAWLEASLRMHRITPMYAFSAREVAEVTLRDGSIKKTAAFRHKGLV